MAEYRASLPLVPICQCKGCGKEFKPGGRDRMTYCSRACAFAHRAAKPKPVIERPTAQCVVCAVSFVQKHPMQRFCGKECRRATERAKQNIYVMARYRAEWTPAPVFRCAECGKPHQPAYGDTHRTFCSNLCANRKQRRITNGRRRARIAGARVESVNHVAVFMRDGWRCQLCGVRTPRRHQGTTKLTAPELDHIVPLSLGGEHSYRNTQCACRACNGAKGATIKGQLRLVG